jgi:hypothetical protein
MNKASGRKSRDTVSLSDFGFSGLLNVYVEQKLKTIVNVFSDFKRLKD